MVAKVKTKPIRLIELFAGIGSQAKALKNIGIAFEHHSMVEYDKYAVCAYNAIHNTLYSTSDITKISGSDLNINETDKYDYLMTYSFPCQDLSIAGKGKGMAKGSGTRSGLLWEVERLLLESKEKPQFLLMENVPQVHGKKNIDNFLDWINAIGDFGFISYWADLNAKHYSIPQNRNRTFMVSMLKGSYVFPEKQSLILRLKDILEEEVSEKYYVSDATIERMLTTSFCQGQRRLQEKDICDTLCARDYKDPKLIQVATLHTLTGANRQPKVLEPIIGASRGRYPNNIGNRTAGIKTIQRLEIGESISNTLTTVLKDTLVIEPCGYTTNISNNFQTKLITGINSTIERGVADACVFEPVIMENFYKIRKERFYKNIAPTIRAGRQGLRVLYGYRIRKLTPLEYWRLMGFSDIDFNKAQKALNETFYKGKNRSSSQLYKMAGNSIVVPVLEAVFQKIFKE